MSASSDGKEHFDKEVLSSDKPVLVDFYAPWCSHCRSMSPVIDALAKDYGDQVKFVMVDIDRQPAIAQQYNVSGVPTIMLFRDGEVQATTVGEQTKEKIQQMLG